MAQNKTIPTAICVEDFLNAIGDTAKRDDAFKLLALLKDETTLEPKMWGTAIVGFGSYHYKYESGREGDAPLVGFSPRSKEFAIYLAAEFADKEKLLQQLGKHKTGISCLYIKKLADIDEKILKKMVNNSVTHLKTVYG